MRELNFSGVEAEFSDYEDKQDLTCSVMITTACAPETPSAPGEVLVLLPTSPEKDVASFASKIAWELKCRGSDVTTAPLQDVKGLDVTKKSCLLLLDAGKHQPFLPTVSEEDWEALKHIIFTCADCTYVTRGGSILSENPQANLMTGLARSIRSENPGLAVSVLDLDFDVTIDSGDSITAVLEVFAANVNHKDQERPDWEVAIRDGQPMVQRLRLEKGMNELIKTFNVATEVSPASFKQEGRPLTLDIGAPGRLDTMRFVDDHSALVPLDGNQVEIEVKSAGLNFKDVMIAMGQLSKHALGLDAAGVVSRVGSDVKSVRPGDRVMTWKQGTFSNFIHADESMVQPMPEGFDFNTAASVPLVYSTAYYAIVTAGRLRPSESVLIHSAAGGFGQAAIMLSQHLGAEVYATVSSREKKQLLVDEYGVPHDHIFNSRDASFAAGIMRRTGGRGVDVVLNQLAGDLLRESWHCIARFGRFVEVGRKDIVGNTGLEMTPFTRNVSFQSVNLIDLIDHDVAQAAEVFREVMTLVRGGTVRPVTPITAMPFSRAEEAFRLMQTGKHVGKIVLEAVDDDVVQATPPSMPPMRFRPDATYVIAGGSGGLGSSMAYWLVQSGAKNILLLSRSGAQKASVRDLLARLGSQGARIEAWACDVSDKYALLQCLERCETEGWPAIRGVIQGAMVLRDSVREARPQ